ncbi:MAG: IclR family transcriptional regulator [Pseudomonadota bacterium]
MTVSSRIPTNLRPFLILETVGSSQVAMTPAEIGRAVGLGKQTTHRLCATLQDEGLLVRDEAGRGLRAGRRARLMATGILHSSSAHFARHQILREVADQIGETVNYVVPEDRGMAYHDRVETNWAFRIQLAVGAHVPFHCTASGKTFLASLSKPERTRLVHVMSLSASTSSTITEPEKLLKELAQISKQGFALDDEEFIINMVAIGVPVLDTQKRYCASLAFHAPKQRVSVQDALEIVPVMKAASAKLTQTLFSD